MVLTRNRSKHNKTKTRTAEIEGTSTSAAATQMDQTTNTNNEEEEKKLEDLKLVASLVDWGNYDAIAGKIFYKKFGQTLERKLEEFEQTKNELKGMVRAAIGNMKAMQTPKKVKPAEALKEQINRYKEFNFDSGEDEAEESNNPDDVEETFTLVQAEINLVPATPEKDAGRLAQQIDNVKLDEDMATPTAYQKTPSVVQSTPVTPMAKKQKMGTPYQKLPPLQSSSSMKKLAITQSMQKNMVPSIPFPPLYGQGTSKGTPGRQALDTTFQKKAKLKEIDEKVELAKKAREEQLKEKAERTKREAEERRRRVEQNKKQKEQERIEKEARAREQQEIVRKFVADQKKQQMASPFRAAPAAAAPKNPVAAKAKGNGKAQTPPPPMSPPRSPQLSPILAYNDDISNMEEDELLEEVSVYDLTKEKIPLPSTKENYNVDDLSSGDETDNDEQPKKTVPSWAQKENIVARIHAIRPLLTNDRIERHFGRIRQPTVHEFFAGYDKKYPQRRQSSATWNSPMSDPTPGVGRFQDLFSKGGTKIKPIG